MDYSRKDTHPLWDDERGLGMPPETPGFCETSGRAFTTVYWGFIRGGRRHIARNAPDNTRSTRLLRLFDDLISPESGEREREKERSIFIVLGCILQRLF